MTIKDDILEAIADAVPECKTVTAWINDGGVSDLRDKIITIIEEHLDAED